MSRTTDRCRGKRRAETMQKTRAAPIWETEAWEGTRLNQLATGETKMRRRCLAGDVPQGEATASPKKSIPQAIQVCVLSLGTAPLGCLQPRSVLASGVHDGGQWMNAGYQANSYPYRTLRTTAQPGQAYGHIAFIGTSQKMAQILISESND